MRVSRPRRGTAKPIWSRRIHREVSKTLLYRVDLIRSTASFSLQYRQANSRQGAKADYKNRQGLLPARGPQAPPRGSETGGATYVVNGHTIHPGSGSSQFGDEFISEKLGRKRTERQKRKLEEKETEEALKKLMQNGSGTTGGRYLKAVRANVDLERNIEDEEEGKKRPFSAMAIKRIGFDPSSRSLRGGEDVQKRVSAQRGLVDERLTC